MTPVFCCYCLSNLTLQFYIWVRVISVIYMISFLCRWHFEYQTSQCTNFHTSDTLHLALTIYSTKHIPQFVSCTETTCTSVFLLLSSLDLMTHYFQLLNIHTYSFSTLYFHFHLPYLHQPFLLASEDRDLLFITQGNFPPPYYNPLFSASVRSSFPSYSFFVVCFLVIPHF